MKKITILSAAVIALAFASCKKEKKGVAKAACIKTTQEYTSGSNTYVQTADCKLK